jgi:hypothetical protein
MAKKMARQIGAWPTTQTALIAMKGSAWISQQEGRNRLWQMTMTINKI